VEKLLDGIIPDEDDRYTLVLMATPTKMVEQRKIELYEAYSQMAHHSGFESNLTINDSRSIADNS